MKRFELLTKINAPVERCFDLARSIDFHQVSTGKTKEIAVEGVKNGLIGLHQQVTWEATHFKIRQRLTSKITAYEYPGHFRDEQVKGIFKYMKHDHFFEFKEEQTWMKDVFEFEAPFGLLGKIIEHYLLKNYLEKFIMERNELLKIYAEGDEWKIYLT
jgi:ligand-binding SRPBCC domain-containing protein